MNANNWRAIIFDLDDTLYPERDYVLSGFHAVAAWAEGQFGIPARQGLAELRAYFEAGVRGHTFNDWFDAHQIDRSNLPQAITIYREHWPAIAPFPEVISLLDQLHQYYSLGLISDGYLAVQERKLAALGLRDKFDVVVFSDALGRDAWKPSSRPFEAALRQLGVGAEQGVYVADNALKDFAGAKKLAMFTIWVRRAGGEYAVCEPPTAEFAPHVIISALDEVKQFLL